MASFDFDRADSQFIVQQLSNASVEAALPPANPLPPVSQAVGPLPPLSAVNPVTQANPEHLATSVTQQLPNIAECESGRDRSSSPNFIQLTTITMANGPQPGLAIKQESTTPPVNQAMNQLQQYAFVPSHNHFVAQQVPSNVNTPTPPLSTGSGQMGGPQMIHNLSQICPQIQQPLMQQQQVMPQQQTHQILHQMAQPMMHSQIPQQHPQLQAHQQAQFQQFQNPVPEFGQQHQVVTIVNNNPTLQRSAAGAVGHIPPEAMSQQFGQAVVGLADNGSKAALKRKRQSAAQDSDEYDDQSEDNHSNSMPIKKRPHQVPEDLKDDAYWEKRKKNNDSARRSREARRMKEEQVAMRVVYLENENLQLRTEVTILKTEIEKLRGMLYE